MVIAALSRFIWSEVNLALPWDSPWTNLAFMSLRVLRANSFAISSGSALTTWAAVTMYPSGVITHPVPTPVMEPVSV